jgi:hypothetical protein
MLSNASEARQQSERQSAVALTVEELDDIRIRGIANHDVKRLLAETERLSDSLSDCWLVLDQIAKDQTANPKQLAEGVLSRQQAPGWKR